MKHCTNCGAELPEGVTVCPACGADMSAEQVIPASVETVDMAENAPEVPQASTATPGVGWSDKLDDPVIKKVAERQRKGAKVFGIIFGLLFPIGFAVAGWLIKAIPFKMALIVGVSLGVIMFVISLLRTWSLNKPVWEGAVADKTAVEHTDKKEKTHTDYTIIFKGIAGGHKRLKFRDDPERYGYFVIGDKVRFYPAFGTYEKRDKSGDGIIFCNVCGAKNDIAAQNCTRCKSPLFK